MVNDPRPFFAFYPDDFWGSDAVEGMTMEAAGLYLAVLSRCWRRGSVNADPESLKALFGRRCSAWEESWQMVRRCFFERDGRLYNERLEQERVIADALSMKASSSAKARWARWKATQDANAMRPHSERIATAMPTQCDRNANAMQGEDRREEERIGESRKGAPSRAVPVPDAWLSVFTEFPTMNTGEAHAAYREWIDYRKASKIKPWGVTTLRKSLRTFEGHGTALWCSAIDESIRNGWQGLFTPKRASGAPSALQHKPGGMREWFAQQDAKAEERIVDVKKAATP